MHDGVHNLVGVDAGAETVVPVSLGKLVQNPVVVWS